MLTKTCFVPSAASSVHHGVREKITGSGGRSSSNPKSVQGDMPLSAPQAGSFRRGSYLSAQGTAASRAHAAAAAAKKSRVEAYQGRAAISRQGTNFSRKEEVSL